VRESSQKVYSNVNQAPVEMYSPAGEYGDYLAMQCVRNERFAAMRGIDTDAVWLDAAADMGGAGAERVAFRLRLQNLEPKEEGGRSEQCLRNRLDRHRGSGCSRSSGSRFVVSRSGEAYDS